jgi:hypothetical protein
MPLQAAIAALDDAPAGPWSSEEPPTALAARIASRFELPRPLEAFEFPEKGNINLDTYLIQAGRAPAGGGGKPRECLLQRINQQVFTRPRSVMAAMIASLDAQRRSLEAGLLPPGRQWEVIELIPARSGAPYLECSDRRGRAYWRLMVRIGGSKTYKSLGEIPERRRRLAVAEEAGRGLALYGDFTAGMDVTSLRNPLPGYRETPVYFDQLASVLAGNRTLSEAEPLLPAELEVRESTREHFLVHSPEAEYRRRLGDPALQRFIALAREEAGFGLLLSRARQEGRIRTVGIHGDTKLENFLFCEQSGQVKALVDLDTIMPQTWLVDWGDMVRSLANIAGEKAADPREVRADMEVYEAVARGFLSTARQVTADEVALMVDAVLVITLELGVRFLTDYLRGDSYFKLAIGDPPDLNRTRAMVQLALFEDLRSQEDAARRLVERLARSARS